jgi:hypothetical protein
MESCHLRWQNWRFPRCDPSHRFRREKKAGLTPQNETEFFATLARERNGGDDAVVMDHCGMSAVW